MEPILLQTSEEDRGARLDAFLARAMEDLTRSAATKAIEEGRVLVSGKVPSKSLKLTGNETIEFTPEEQVLIDYGRAIANDPKHVPEELFTRLKTYFNEEQIVVVTAMGVMMIANNYFNDILDVTPDHLA